MLTKLARLFNACGEVEQGSFLVPRSSKDEVLLKAEREESEEDSMRGWFLMASFE